MRGIGDFHLSGSWYKNTPIPLIIPLSISLKEVKYGFNGNGSEAFDLPRGSKANKEK
jgi:hypothetical protein